MAEYAPIRVTPETGRALRSASFKLSAKLGRRITYGETVTLALLALERVDVVALDESAIPDERS